MSRPSNFMRIGDWYSSPTPFGFGVVQTTLPVAFSYATSAAFLPHGITMTQSPYRSGEVETAHCGLLAPQSASRSFFHTRLPSLNLTAEIWPKGPMLNTMFPSVAGVERLPL